jgi:hypothetical protein
MAFRITCGVDEEVLRKLLQSVLDGNSDDSEFSNDESESDVSISESNTDSSDDSSE